MRSLGIVVTAFWIAASLGCARVPPSYVMKDRFDYGQAIGESWERQTLMNVVRIRYAHAPVFLDVSSVINSYNLGGSGSLGANVGESPAPNLYTAGVSGFWSHSPTVMYEPLTGDKFTKNLLTPIPLASILDLMRAGWPAEMILPIAVRSVNSMTNQSRGMVAEPEFMRLVDAWSRIQQSEAIDFRVEVGKDGDAVVLVIGREDAAAVRQDAETLRRLLGLESGTKEAKVVVGQTPHNNQEVAMLTRSMLEIMVELGFGIEVPAEEIRERRVAAPPLQAAGAAGEIAPLFVVHSGQSAPADSYVAVPYRGTWYWIDDRDLTSKRTFSFLLILFSMAETGRSSAAPLITIGAGR